MEGVAQDTLHSSRECCQFRWRRMCVIGYPTFDSYVSIRVVGMFLGVFFLCLLCVYAVMMLHHTVTSICPTYN